MQHAVGNKDNGEKSRAHQREDGQEGFTRKETFEKSPKSVREQVTWMSGGGRVVQMFGRFAE